jgi:hypothetical protein
MYAGVSPRWVKPSRAFLLVTQKRRSGLTTATVEQREQREVEVPSVKTVAKNAESLVSGPLAVPRLKLKKLNLAIVGTSPLIPHRSPVEHMQAKASGNKESQADWKDLCYVLEGKAGDPKAIYGFPSFGLKYAFISAAREIDSVPMSVVAGAIEVVPDDRKNLLLRLFHDASSPRGEDIETVVGKSEKNPAGKTIKVCRPVFRKWGIQFQLIYAVNTVSEEQIKFLLKTAGENCGLGDRRKGRGGDGSFGAFRLASEDELAKLFR